MSVSLKWSTLEASLSILLAFPLEKLFLEDSGNSGRTIPNPHELVTIHNGKVFDFIRGILNDSDSVSDYVASNYRTSREWWLWRDVEGSRPGPVWVLISAVAGSFDRKSLGFRAKTGT